MKRILVLTTVVLLLAIGVGKASAQSGYDLYQKALVKERAAGNVDVGAWTSDGRHLIFGKSRTGVDQPTIELWRIPVGGGEPQSLGVEMVRIAPVRVHLSLSKSSRVRPCASETASLA